jgi:hypothetical protein
VPSLRPPGTRDPIEALTDFVRDELDFERIAAALREQVRVHPVRSLAIAALGGLIASRLLRRD